MSSIRRSYTVMTKVSVLWWKTLRSRNLRVFCTACRNNEFTKPHWTFTSPTSPPPNTWTHTENTSQNSASWSYREYFRALQQNQRSGNRALFCETELLSLDSVKLLLTAGVLQPILCLTHPHRQIRHVLIFSSLLLVVNQSQTFDQITIL